MAYTDAKGAEQKIDADKLIVSIGRVPNTQGLNPEAVGLPLDERGAIVQWTQTAAPACPMCGRWVTVVRGPMLAQGGGGRRAWPWPSVSRGSMGMSTSTQFHWVIYTSPEIAWANGVKERFTIRYFRALPQRE